MCGIVGYIGNREAQPILVNALKRLEYRGYDSCGTAVSASAIQLHKDIGRIAQLEETLPVPSARKGIGHTRWATHGKPSKANAHPHLDCTGDIAVVHNGVIDNYQTLRDRLIEEGHIFHSETDTEVVSHLIEKHFSSSPDFKEAVRRALLEIEGSYAIIALHAYRHELVVARKESPLIIGLGEDETFIFTVGNARPLDQALQHATTEMLRWLQADYGLDAYAAHILLGQTVRYDVGNCIDPAYTMICKVPKSALPPRVQG